MTILATVSCIDWKPVDWMIASAGNLRAVGEADAVGVSRSIATPALHLDLAGDDQLGGADVDIVARAGAVGLHHQAGVVLAEIEEEARRFEALVELGVMRADLLVERALRRRLQREGRRGGDHVGLVDIDAVRDRRLRIDVEGELHQRLGADHRGRRALHHGDVGAGLPEVDRRRRGPSLPRR